MKEWMKKIPVKIPPEYNRIFEKTPVAPGIQKARKRIYRQATLTIMTILLTVMILFAMTSAWYTNVVQTSGLTFETEAWGFEGNITVDSRAIQAAPGDEDVINLTVENDSDSVSAISVNILKNGMSDEMQKRLFFYVDTTMERGEETMNRVYLNRFETYTYHVFNNSALSLTKEYHNAPLIKWEWVYDVLGYYVIAEPYEVTKEDGTVIKEMRIHEYLRPIEYDFDETTTKINTEGEQITIELDKIGGEYTLQEFLAEISLTDGYMGVIDADDHAFDNFYRVDVDQDQNGYGVYAYICNYSEILAEGRYDSMIGELAYRNAKGEELNDEQKAYLRYGVTLTLSAQKDDENILPVNTLSGLQAAITETTADVLQLTSDMTVLAGETITIPEGRRLMIDLNGNELINTDGTAITAQPGSSLTMVNGTLSQADLSGTTNTSSTYGIKSTGAEVLLSNVSMKDFRYAVYVSDNQDSNVLDSRIYIKEANIEAKDYGVYILGNGLLSAHKSQVIIEDSTLTSHEMVIVGNGDATGNGKWGTDIQILNSTIIAHPKENATYNSTGIYQPQKNSTLVVRNSHVEGGNAIALKGGSTRIDNSTIVGCGFYTQPSFSGSGYSDTGDAVYIETNYGYEIDLLICGNSDLSHVGTEGSRSLRVFEENAPHVKVEIESGIFDEEQPAAYVAKNSAQSVTENNRYVVVMPESVSETTGEQSDENTEAE